MVGHVVVQIGHRRDGEVRTAVPQTDLAAPGHPGCDRAVGDVPQLLQQRDLRRRKAPTPGPIARRTSTHPVRDDGGQRLELRGQQLKRQLRRVGPCATRRVPVEIAADMTRTGNTTPLLITANTWNPGQVLGTPDDRELGVMVDRVVVE